MAQHKAAGIPAAGKAAEVIEVATTSPAAGEVLVENHAVGIGPLDYFIRDTGFMVQNWPMIVGADAAGQVVEVGPGVQNLKKGDRVLVGCTFFTGQQSQAGHQEKVIGLEVAVTKIPDSLSYVQACALPSSVAAAAAGLYQKGMLGLDLPSTTPKRNGQKILIWGAASSVATSAIQLAVASGYEVITTASEKNFDYATGLGASKVFDYKSPSVVGDLVAELQKGKCIGAYDGKQRVVHADTSIHTDSLALAISMGDTLTAIATVLAQIGGGKIVHTLPSFGLSVPATVELVEISAVAIFFGENKSVGEAVFQDFLPKALASGQFVALPKAEVVGKGVESIDKAMNIHKAGVSAKRIVVEI